MPGIIGIAGRATSREIEQSLLNMMGRCLRFPGDHERTHLDHDGWCGVVQIIRHCKEAAQQIRLPGNIIGLVDGSIYSSDAEPDAAESGESEVLRELRSQLRKCRGKFNLIAWDPRSRRLYIASDRFGMKPLYYAHLTGRILFASEIKSLFADADMPTQTDLRGLSQFFTFGQLLGESTLFSHVHVLPAASILVYDADSDSVTVEKYWNLTASASERQTDLEAIERIDSALTQSVERMTNGVTNLGLSLSGGLDARTLLGILGPNRPLTTLSLGMPGSMDHRSAEQMARQLGYQHQQVLLDDEFLDDYENHLRQMVRLTDGQYLCQCIVMPTLPIYRHLGIRVLLRGHVGELMHMTKAYSFSLDREALQIRDQRGLFDWLWRHLQAFMLNGTQGKLFAQSYRSDMEGLARDSLKECINQTEDTDPVPHRIWQMFFEQRTRRETALSVVEFESVVETRLPFLDHDVIEALFAAPPELKLGDRIQTAILARHRPELLKVVNVNTGTYVGARGWRKQLAAARLKIFARLGVPGYQPYERLGLWLRRELRPLVQRLLLSERCLSRDVFDPNTVRHVVDDHLNQRRNHTYLLLALMIYEVAQQEFVDSMPVPVRSAVA